MGGDGGLTNCVRALLAEQINLEKLYFVSLPFGSGNDTSRVFGWGKTADESHLSSLYYITLDAAERTIKDKLNIFDVQIEMQDIWKVGEDRQDVSLKASKSDTILQLQMCNYWSMGECCKVGWQVE